MSSAHTIPDALIDEIKSRLDIVSFIEASVTIKKTGANYSGLCPFHSEKTPSFTVSPSKQFYHCFGCGAHGDVIKWHTDYVGLSWIDALKMLAGKAGVPLPERRQDPAVIAAEERKHPLYDALAHAGAAYVANLNSDQGLAAKRYLLNRGLTEETLALFGIGYAMDDWQGLQHVFPDYSAASLIDCGLVIDDAAQRRRYDRFRDRVMFPIANRRGYTIAFGARTLVPDGKPKYLNSPETPVFEKGRELYGLVLALPAIRRDGHAIVVEGYLDTAMMHQHGFTNVVAGCGTAVTEAHLQTLLTLASKVTFAFDGDAAGRNAATRALDRILPMVEDKHTVAFAFLPEGEDPDTFVRTYGAADMQRVLDRAIPLSKAICNRLTPKPGAPLEDRAALAKEAERLLPQVHRAPILCSLLYTEVERILGTSLSRLPGAPAKPRHRAEESSTRPAATGPTTAKPTPVVMQHVVQPVLRLMLAFPETIAVLPDDLRRQPIIGALAPLIERTPDIDLLLDNLKADRVLVRAIEAVAMAAIERRDISDATSALADAAVTFGAARDKFLRLEPCAQPEREPQGSDPAPD
jgi:DNA primase